MQLGSGGLYITGGSATFNAAPTTGSEITTYTAVHRESRHGEASVVPDASTGRLTMQPGRYLVIAEFTVEGQHATANSGDFAGVISLVLARGGTALTGAKSKIQDITEGLPMHISVTDIVEITLSSQQAATPTNYVSAYLIGGDASGNDLVITEGRLIAVRLD